MQIKSYVVGPPGTPVKFIFERPQVLHRSLAARKRALLTAKEPYYQRALLTPRGAGVVDVPV